MASKYKKELKKILNEGGKFADIGCGHGYSSALIAENYKNC